MERRTAAAFVRVINVSPSVGQAFDSRDEALLALSQFVAISNRRHVFKNLKKSEYEEFFYACFTATQIKFRSMHDICRFRANIICNSDVVWTTTQFVPQGFEPHTHLNRRYGRTA